MTAINMNGIKKCTTQYIKSPMAVSKFSKKKQANVQMNYSKSTELLHSKQKYLEYYAKSFDRFNLESNCDHFERMRMIFL